MTVPGLVIVGGGGHARVVIDAALSRAETWTLVGVVDPDGASLAMSDMGVRHLGDDDAFIDTLVATPAADRPWLVIGVGGDLMLRRSIAARYAPLATWATIVHVTAWVSPSARIDPGAVVLGGAQVNAGATVGPHAIVNTAAIVEHDVEIGAFGHVAPGAALGGGARLGAGTFVGLGARIRDHVALGEGAVVGMGAVVVRSVPDGATVTGVPARITASIDG